MGDSLESMFGAPTGPEGENEETSSSSLPSRPTTGLRKLASIESGVQQIGGGRRVIAECEIPPGVLLVAEIPTATWAGAGNLQDTDTFAAAVEVCCCDPAAYKITSTLHPQQLSSCVTEEIQRVQELISSDRQQEIATKSGLSKEEVVRVILVLQHNGFGSGLYGQLTMLNHSCNPNAIKFSPCAGSLGASEIWSVRSIAPGEEITISYCEPLEMTRQSVQEFLKSHHGFTCQCSECLAPEIGDKTQDGDSKSPPKANQIAHESKLQEMILGLEQELKFWQSTPHDIDGAIQGVTRLMKNTTEMAAVESEGEGFAVSSRLLARLHKLAANAAATFLDFASKFQQQRGKRPKRELLKTAAFSFLRNSLSLLWQQLTYLGPHHPDVASSHIDMAEALECAMNMLYEDLSHALTAGLSDEGSAQYREFSLLKIKLARATAAAAAGANHTAAPDSTNKSSEVAGKGEAAVATTAAVPSVASALISKRAIQDEIQRFRAEGSRIKNLYARRHFPGLFQDLRSGKPGAYHWGNLIPTGHSKLL
jgi:SET domain